MSELEIIDEYERNYEKKGSSFLNNVNSTLRVQTDIKKIEVESDWIDIIEETLPHIDGIFRSPNRFIVNDEEIVKIESAKKITVDSIKHLAKHTNLIQTVDSQTGDVQPGKILNINKEEDYDTYENRLIYTLIQKIKMFLSIKENQLIENMNQKRKNNKALEYKADSKLKDETINITVALDSKLDDGKCDLKKETEEVLAAIEEIRKKITELQTASVYKIIDKKHISWVKEPIKKTNVVLKNVHFQYAMKLWEFLKENMDEKNSIISEEEDYMDDGILKKLVDETFLLQYVAMKTLDQEENEEISYEFKNIIIEQMIDRILDIDLALSESDVKQLIAAKYEIVKYKKMEAIKDIQNIFKVHIEKYLQDVENREV